PLGEKRNHPGSKLRQGFWMVFRLGVNNWGLSSSLSSPTKRVIMNTAQATFNREAHTTFNRE
ncbi:hypothetical protein, partial [Streptococcus pneumoniae]|uniref:hypothetical protein n=1 Tax=Streptococcus pneumoniae TaxID=1313 RepID=UPI0009A08A48